MIQQQRRYQSHPDTSSTSLSWADQFDPCFRSTADSAAMQQALKVPHRLIRFEPMLCQELDTVVALTEANE